MEINIFNTTLLLIINICILIYSVWINKKIFKSYQYISIAFIFSLFFFFFYIVVHSYVVYSGEFNRYYENTVNKFYPLLAEIIATLCNFFYNLGVTFFAFNKKNLNLHILPIKKYSNTKLFKIGLFIFSIGVLSKVITWLYLGNGNVINYLTSYYKIQLNMASEGSGIEKYLGFLYSLIEIGAYILYSNYQATKKRKTLTLIVVLLSFLTNFNSRGSIIRLLIGYLIITALYVNAFRKNIKKYVIAIILPIILIVTLGLGAIRDATKGYIWNCINPVYMVLGVNHSMRGLSDELEYKNLFPFQWGNSIILPIVQKPIPRKYWPNKHMSSTMFYASVMYPNMVEAGGGIAAGLCADIYLNFSLLGLFVIFTLMGYSGALITYSLLNIILNNKSNIFWIIVYATLAEFNFFLRGEDVALIVYFYMLIFIPLCIIFLNIKVRYELE